MLGWGYAALRRRLQGIAVLFLRSTSPRPTLTVDPAPPLSLCSSLVEAQADIVKSAWSMDQRTGSLVRRSHDPAVSSTLKPLRIVAGSCRCRCLSSRQGRAGGAAAAVAGEKPAPSGLSFAEAPADRRIARESCGQKR